MAKPQPIPSVETLQDALVGLLDARGRRQAASQRIRSLKDELEKNERQAVDLDKEIAERAAALKKAHARIDLFEWAAKV